MCCYNPHFDINKLALIGALLVLMGDFIALLVAYQSYCDSLSKKNGDSYQAFPESRSLDIQRLRQDFR
jgi:hypothetical protein